MVLVSNVPNISNGIGSKTTDKSLVPVYWCVFCSKAQVQASADHKLRDKLLAVHVLFILLAVASSVSSST